MVKHTSYSRRSVLKTAGGAASVASIAGCLGSSGSDTITFGAPGFSGGKYSSLQPPVTETIKMAEKEINDAGGIQGKDLEIKIRSTASRPQQMRTVMQTFANEDEVDAVVAGGVSSELVSIYDFLKDFEIPIVSPYTGAKFWDQKGGDNGTPGDLSDDGWVWRTAGSDTVFAAATALQCLKNDLNRVAVMHSPSAGARSWRDSFEHSIEKGGGKAVTSLEFEAGKTSYNPELEELFKEDFDAWLLVGSRKDKTTIVRQWANGNYGGQLLLDNNLGKKLLEGIGKPGKGAWICAAAEGGGPNKKRFKKKYKEFTDRKMNTFCAAAYDTIIPAALALHAADEVSPAGVEKNLGPVGRDGGKTVTSYKEGKKALDNGNSINLEGASSNLDFTKYGNVLPPTAVYRVTPSGYKQFKKIDLDELQEIANF